MTIQQLSVFLENKTGNLNDLLNVLGESHINIIALTIADTSDYGIVRLIVSDPLRAQEKLKNKHFSVRIHEVISIEMSPNPGSLAEIINFFTKKHINIEYLYAFSFGSKSIVVLRTNDREAAFQVINENDLISIRKEDLTEEV